MKLLFVRHGEPDYAIDSLTEKGWREAEYLANKLACLDLKEIYVSICGRAKDTALPTLNKTGRTAIECEWLQEFVNTPICRPDLPKELSVPWDWLPNDWSKDKRFFHKELWGENELFTKSHVKEEYDRVIREFDSLLERHGYIREETYYIVQENNEDTLVFFCHFGVIGVILSHLLNVSPMILWQGTCAAPSSITTVVTEERREGIASFRLTSFGDVSHLYKYDEIPSFAGRFCECYNQLDERYSGPKPKSLS